MMSAVFELSITSETLSPDEIAEITGCSRRSDQVEWLSCNGWMFHKNKASEPIVGRFYARLKMAGITPAILASRGAWMPNFSGIQ